MAWTLYRVTWRLESPLHSGFAKLGNIQRTRLYLTGRILWGALTARLTRDQGRNDYNIVGDAVNQHLAISYGYLCLTEDGGQPLLPQYTANGLQFKLDTVSLTEREAQRLFLTSYASTALDYSSNTAVDGSLHEVEFISPRTLSSLDKLGIQPGQQLYVSACIAESDSTATDMAVKDWKRSVKRLQIGGERNYGFGKISREDNPITCADWWGTEFISETAQVKIQSRQQLLAHTKSATSLPAEAVEYGTLEPLIGRDTTPQGAFGQNINHIGVCWQPGTTVKRLVTCQIGSTGIWQPIS